MRASIPLCFYMFAFASLNSIFIMLLSLDSKRKDGKSLKKRERREKELGQI
jgi:hypothetical protein